MKKLFVTIIILLTLNGFAQHRYYVNGQSGNNTFSGTSLSQAWKTIQHAAVMMLPGDTVFITSGVYNEHVIPQASGTPSQHITYTVYPGDTAIIDGSNFTGNGQYLFYSDRGIFDIKDKKYINVIGLTIRNSGNGGGIMCRYGSSHINIENNHIYNCGATGIGAGYSRYGHPLATNIVAKGNLLERCSLISRESLSFRSVIGFEISNNIVRDTPKEGIDAKSGCSDGIICYNYVSNAGAVGIYIDAGYPDPLYTSSHNIHVYNNVCDRSKSSIAVASEEGCLGEDIWIYNNVISNAAGGNGIIVASFGDSGPVRDIHIVNNTIYNSDHRGIYVNHFNSADIYIRNNICSQNNLAQIAIRPPGPGQEAIDSVYIENNLIDGVNVENGIAPVFGNPGFVNPNAGDFHLLATSSAIDQGTAIDAPNVDFDGVYRPLGNGYDIGAYEYLSDQCKRRLPFVSYFVNEVAAKGVSRVDVGSMSKSLGAKLSVIDLDKKDNIVCYPDPAQDVLLVEGDDVLSIQILNSSKRCVQQIEVDKEVTKVNLSHLGKGVYYLKIVSANGSSLKQIIHK